MSAAALAVSAVALVGQAPLVAAKIVDWGQLLEVVEAGLIAGVGISVAFSLLILGAVRAGEARQESRTISMVLHGTLAAIMLIVCVGAVGFGVSTMLSK
ncbi:hypothetical protein [Conexibacter arvalis]|uniref:Uncharacterized protein n=1 Tax=Conexibacter arvalis TaxID=912552 RepID=A0A840IJ08_9ACTN|nr:hypothetical protein [Conexibacter arvalis]MBB4664004.1 hypothetical protein [Conexibacter arvalis]